MAVKEVTRKSKGANTKINERVAPFALKDITGVSKKSTKPGKINFPAITLGASKNNLEKASLIGLSSFQNKAALRLDCST